MVTARPSARPPTLRAASSLALALALVLVAAACRERRDRGPRTPAAVATSSVAQAASSAQRADRRPLGIGLSAVAEWDPRLPFLDLVKQARPWESRRGDGRWTEGGPLATDARGWVTRLEPGQTARLLVTIEVERLPFREFVVRWAGRGRLAYAGNAVRAGDGPAGWADRVRLTPGPRRDFFSIVLTQTDPKDPLRDLVVVPAEHRGAFEEGARFNPRWLERIRPFRALRFMDWMQTNHTRQRRWSDRPRPEDMTWQRAGVPVEVMIELANQLDVDPWFTLPHLADADYVRQFALEVRRRLSPTRIAWFERSNEVWNLGFPQARDAEAAGRLRWRAVDALPAAIEALDADRPAQLGALTEGRVPWSHQLVRDDVAKAGLQKAFAQARARARLSETAALERLLSAMMAAAPPDVRLDYHGARSAEMCDVLRDQVFAKARHRVRCVIATHTTLHGLEDRLLDCPRWSEAPCRDHGFDALAITGYLGSTLATAANAAPLRSWANQGEAGVKKLVAELGGARALPEPVQDIRHFAEHLAHYRGVAKRRGLELVAYEGGQHLAANHWPALRDDPEVQALFATAQRHPDMGALYRRLLDTWKAGGGRLFVHYSDVTVCGKYGCWGALEALDRDSPKYHALVAWGRGHPRWWSPTPAR